MSNFEETIARMKGLYTYGKELNEGNDFKSHTLEYHAIAADGKSYGIIRECNKYYIKSAPKDKEMVAEAYDYLGGFCNKGNYEYKSYANALKNFELKMASINEACEGNVNISTLDPFKKEEFLVEGTERMRDEIARQRQIMYNASMIMNESNEIGASNSDGVVKFNGKNPETPKKNGNSINDGTDAKVVEQDNVKGFSGNNPHEKQTSGPYTQKASSVNENACCEKCGNNPCTCEQCNEEAGDIGDAPLMPNTENWGTEGIGKGRDPKQVGWEMDGQQNVNEETNEWDEGLPGSAGVGDADTDHNNDPFNKSINESEEDGENSDTDKGSESSDNGETNDDFGGESGDSSTDTDFDDGLSDDFGEEGGEDDGEFEEGDFSEDDFGEEGDEFGGEEGEEDLRAEIESLKAELEALKAQINGGEDDLGGDDLGGDDLGGDDLDGDDLGGDDLGGDEFGGEDDFGGEDFGGDEFGGDEFGGEDDFGGEEPDGEIEECGDFGMMESKQRKMDSIVESVVKRILKEDELHVFGKHPGYRKQPMELPTTGEDQNQWGRDWNDDSVHSEEPFGSKIGNGDPFKELVNAITKDVMYQLKKGIPIEGDKKKEE